MLKRTTIISAIVLAACLIAFFALSPLAISDSVILAQQAEPSYAVLSELSQYTAENIKTVTLTGYGIDSLEVRPSADSKIHVLTDNYSIASPTFQPRRSDGGVLELYCSPGGPSPITLLTRENILRVIVAELNNASLNRLILELPSSTAFEPGEYGAIYCNSLFIDERVTVLEKDELIASEEETIFENSTLETAASESLTSLDVAPLR